MVTIGGQEFTERQTSHVGEVIATCKENGWSQRAAMLAVMTILTESNAYNYANPHVPGSILVPGNDGYPSSGGDYDSLGLFQQRANWGSVENRLNPRQATLAFLNALSRVPNWKTRDAGEVCQAIQVSAFPTRYAERELIAAVLTGAYWQLLEETENAMVIVDVYRDGKRDTANRLATGCIDDSGRRRTFNVDENVAIRKIVGQLKNPPEHVALDRTDWFNLTEQPN